MNKNGMASAAASPLRHDPWGPLRVPIFRAIWTASLLSNVGTWMQNVAAAWLMALLTPSPLLVALVQTATSLPTFLLGLPAGALADIFDRRRVLVITQSWMLAAAALLGIATLAGVINEWTLLAFTFLLGLGAAVNGPAWQAMVPELVERPLLPSAIALNSAGFNAARAIGPAVGGLVVASAGAGMAFVLNAVSFAGVVLVLASWKRPAEASVLPGERLSGAMRAAVRYVRFEPALKAVLWRAGSFAFSASVLWALLPVIARDRLRTGAFGYGVLLGAMGIGAVIGAVLMPRLRLHVRVERLVTASTLVFATVTAGLTVAPDVASSSFMLLAAGAAWSSQMSGYNLAAQQAVPDWIRARAMAVYLLVFQSAMAGGAFTWGLIAEHFTVRVALAGGALALATVAAVGSRRGMIAAGRRDLTPSRHWPLPSTPQGIADTDGPVLVTIEYDIDRPDANAFARAMAGVANIRRRDGASAWALFRDVANERRFLETFVIETWGEHIRQHERVTMWDREVEESAAHFHRGAEPPRIRHLLLTGASRRPLRPTGAE